jgi:hypothetical protein
VFRHVADDPDGVTVRRQRYVKHLDAAHPRRERYVDWVARRPADDREVCNPLVAPQQAVDDPSDSKRRELARGPGADGAKGGNSAAKKGSQHH